MTQPSITQQRMAAIFNEWARLYAQNPDDFGEILDADGSPVEDYGHKCAIYFCQIAYDMDCKGLLPLPTARVQELEATQAHRTPLRDEAIAEIAEHQRAGRYTKKPVTIVANQWFKSGDHPAVRDISDSDDLFFTGMGGATLVEREKFGVIGTLESPNHLVTPGDWIITGVKGEHYPCKPDIFEATYAPAQEKM